MWTLLILTCRTWRVNIPAVLYRALPECRPWEIQSGDRSTANVVPLVNLVRPSIWRATDRILYSPVSGLVVMSGESLHRHTRSRHSFGEAHDGSPTDRPRRQPLSRLRSEGERRSDYSSGLAPGSGNRTEHRLSARCHRRRPSMGAAEPRRALTLGVSRQLQPTPPRRHYMNWRRTCSPRRRRHNVQCGPP